MEHLEFIKELDKLGISIRSINIENKEKIIESSSRDNDISVKDFKVKYINHSVWGRLEPLQQLIKVGIDMDEWKHSMHYNLSCENYEKFVEIIQEKIIGRAKDIDILMTVYFQLRYEISKNKEL